MSETNMDSYIKEMYEDEPVLTQREIIQQMYTEIPDEVNHDISVEEDKELLNESSQPSYSEPCSSNSTSTTMTSNILNPPSLTIPTPSQITISPTLTPNYSCSTFKAKTPSWFEKYENMKKRSNQYTKY
ncbi:uncharacterized protein LOC126554767 [Aphis gossypii]|uniref:uncharacterized protein LOC126554767 n=1 Tax=Aphis gossypii TaxID=80765 RepID=UPI00215903DC|nr:uncharacterized protein LOC126554767 [Aphis gossypii]